MVAMFSGAQPDAGLAPETLTQRLAAIRLMRLGQGLLSPYIALAAVEARDFIASRTMDAIIVITADYGPDRFRRHVVDLQANGRDVSQIGLDEGLLRAWLFVDDGRALDDKPDWCD